MAKKPKFELPDTAGGATCRSCGVLRRWEEYRLFRPGEAAQYMDFCAVCERQYGTLTLYRRFNAYGTPEIVEAVFAAERMPALRRTPEQVRLLVEAAGEAPKTNEELIKRELARRELCRRRLIYYATQFHPSYTPGWVHQDISRRLEQFVKDVEDQKSPRLMIFMPPRAGKLVAHSVPVLTTAGWKTHGELRVGDEVFHPSGRPVRVVALSSEDLASVEVEVSNGDTIKVHPNHEWTVYRRGHAGWADYPRTVETRYFYEPSSKTGVPVKLTSGTVGKRGGRYQFQLPNVAAVEYPEAELAMAPYALGAWLGDGTTGKPWITHAAEDTAVIEAVTACGYQPSKVHIHKTTGVHSTVFTTDMVHAGTKNQPTCLFTRHLNAIGVAHDKHIPEAYFRASVAQRLQLLAGLVDTDGTVDAKSRVCFSTCSPRLAADVERLTRELGMRPYVRVAPPKTSTSGIIGRRDIYIVGFQPTLDIPTRLARKAIKRMPEQRKVAITAVRPCPPEPGRCIQVDSPDGLYLVGKNLTPTHNSALASDLFPSWILGKHPEWSIIASSYAQSLPLEFSRNIRDRLQDSEYQAVFPDTKLRSDAKGIEAWKTTKGGGYIAAGVGTGITGKGFNVGIVDDPIKDQEAADSEVIRDAAFKWYQAVFRTRVAPGAGILFINTRWHWADPAGKLLDVDEQLAKAGIPEDERENWQVVSYPALAEYDEYLMHDGSIVEDANPEEALRLLRKKGEALHPERFSTKDMLRTKNGLSSSMWSALYQQRPTPDEGDYFKRDDFRYRWLDPAYRPLATIFMTADYAIKKGQRNDWTVLVCFALTSDDDLYVLGIRRGRWGTYDIARNIVAMVQEFKPQVYAGEQGQIHEAVWPVVDAELTKERLFVSVDSTLTPIQDKGARARPLQGRMQRHKLFFSHDEFARPEIYDIAEREMLQFPEGTHDDIVDALAWGARLAQNLPLPNTHAPPSKRKSWKDPYAGDTSALGPMAA